jgi:hypothetical protein
MAYIGNFDLTTYKIHGNWTKGHKYKNGKKSYNPIRHVSIDGIHFFEMQSHIKNINFIFDIEIYNKYSNYTWTCIERVYTLKKIITHNSTYQIKPSVFLSI